MEAQNALVKAENANKAKTDFLFNMSHDIRTPMNAITGFLRLLDQQQEDRAKRKEYIHKIGDASGILQAIINNVFEMSQIEIGKGTKFTVITSHRIALETDFDNSKADHEVSAIFSGKRILLAEDNDLNAEIAMEILSEMGLEVERAEDGDLCIDMMKQSKEGYYDLILMDIQKLMETLTDIL